jgi:hypothetical protein
MSPQIAVVDLIKSIDPRDLLFWTKAWDKQAAEFARDWGVPYTPVLPYDKVEDLPTIGDECRLLTIESDIGAPGALGFHDDTVGLIFARVLPDNNVEAAPHEIVEEEGDATCDKYEEMGNGSQVADEAADPVEGDHYNISVTIDGETRDVAVTNYVLRSWFDPNGKAPFDKMGKLTAPLSMDAGGYMIVRDSNGNESDVFARHVDEILARHPNGGIMHAAPGLRVLHGGEGGRLAAAKKRDRPDSRLSRRLALHKAV